MRLRWPFHGSPSSTLMLLASAALMGIALGAPPPASAATFNVTKTADTADGLCDADCSLREAIIAANALAGADTIVVPAGTYVLTRVGASEDAGATGDLDVTGDTTITGAGSATTIVDGNGTDRVFDIRPTAAAVTLSGLTIRNGNVNGFGGGIDKQGSGTLQVQNGVVTNNTATGFGGGINNNDNLGSITIDFTTVSNNVANGFGGGLNNNSGGSFTVRDSTVSGNSAAGFGGGGLNNNSSGTMLVVRTTVSNNTTQNGAGLNNNSTGSLSVADTLISGNTANGGIGGGGILNNSSGALSVFASTISANSSAGFGGGGIDSNSSGAVSIQISTISGNSTTGSVGGGGIYKNSSAVIVVTSSTITGNSSTNGGRNIHLGTAGSLSALNTIIANPASGANCAGIAVISLGFNLASDASCNLIAAGDRPNVNPLLAPLANNGGPTPTHGLQAGSPAIDTGTATSVPIDQRGVVRPVGAGFDIGAFEGTVGGGALPTLSINSVAAAEGNAGTSTLTFTVTLSAASAQTVTVNYATASGTATAGSDFNAASGVLTFAAGVTTQPIPITLIGDTAVEANETFVVNLSAPTNATLASTQGTGTITNDDGAAPPSPADIPTLSEWAMLLLAAMIAGFAGLALRRRNIR